MKGQNWPLSDTENIVKISRYFLNIAISRYFQMMQYIAFAIYHNTNAHPWSPYLVQYQVNSVPCPLQVAIAVVEELKVSEET